MEDEALYTFWPTVHIHVLSKLAYCARLVWKMRFYIHSASLLIYVYGFSILACCVRFVWAMRFNFHSVPLFIYMSSLYWLIVHNEVNFSLFPTVHIHVFSIFAYCARLEWEMRVVFILSHCLYSCLLYTGSLCKVCLSDEV